MTTNAEYHADPAISASHLSVVTASPYHYWKRYLDPQRPPSTSTAAMRLGSLVHCAVLEPYELGARYSTCASRTTKAGKEQAAELAAAGIEAVTNGDMELALAMSDAVRSHPMAMILLSAGKAEQSFWWDDAATGLRCKCRPDWYDGTTIVDLKTTIDASPVGFAKSVASYKYHQQACHYMAGLNAERFIFIAVEKSYPYGVGVYQLDAAAMAAGEALRRQNLQTIADCRAINEWPGYSTGLQPLSLPNWALSTTPTITSDDF